MAEKRSVMLIAGLCFGDEGKGTVVDYVSRTEPVHTIVRYNGGAQAAHNVVTPDGRHHTFAQFGSGMFMPDVRTHLSRFMLIDPMSMVREARHLAEVSAPDVLERTTIDGEALIVTPFQQAISRLKEIARGSRRRGTCGMGIGQTLEDWKRYGERVVLACDLKDPNALRRKLGFIQSCQREALEEIRSQLPDDETVRRHTAIIAESSDFLDDCIGYYNRFARRISIVGREYLHSLFHREGVVVFEGAQGVLLDNQYGFYPHVTSTNITFGNAETLLREAGYDGTVQRLGVLRAYATRHGPGPFVTENQALAEYLPEPHNTYTVWQGGFRVGHFDLVAAQYALDVIGGVDALTITHLDRMVGLKHHNVCSAYRMPAEETVKTHAKLDILDPANFHGREQLTMRLMTAEPIYTVYPELQTLGNALRAAETLAGMLGVPLAFVSYGSSAKEKMRVG